MKLEEWVAVASLAAISGSFRQSCQKCSGKEERAKQTEKKPHSMGKEKGGFQGRFAGSHLRLSNHKGH